MVSNVESIIMVYIGCNIEMPKLEGEKNYLDGERIGKRWKPSRHFEQSEHNEGSLAWY